MNDRVPRLDAGTARLAADESPHSFFTRSGTVHGLFADCARKYPDAVAALYRQTPTTYAELDALSGSYAAALAREGVGPGDLVAVVMRRTPRMLAVLLAILKCGAAYSAMDPRWPAARLADLVTRLHAPLVVTDGPEQAPRPTDVVSAESARAAWPVPTWTPRDPVQPQAAASPATEVEVSPDAPFAVLFTSGSTGEPKGVICSHRSVARLFDVCDWMPYGPGTTMPQVSTASWDGFVLDCWGSLLTGGSTVFVDEEVLLPAVLRDLHDRDGVNATFLTTSLFNMLVDEGLDCFAGIDTIAIGGEKASPLHSGRLLERFPGTRLINIYGPAECGVLATRHYISPADCAAESGIPLGQTVPRTGVHLMEGDRICSEGEVGEICVSGEGLALGYLNDPELTAARFVEVNLGGESSRVYRTGDLGHQEAGTLRFDGRADLQVKVRGHRIEPGELEVSAMRIPDVTKAAAVPLRRDGRVEALALFYASPANVTDATVRKELTERLPAYLLPRRILKLDRFPLLPNGKLDREMLEMIASATEPAPAAATEGLQGSMEVTVAAVFAEVLDVASAPPSTSFFDLGGDSMTAARVCARLGRTMGLTITTSQLHRTPTVRGLAAWIESARDELEVITDQTAVGQPVPLTPMQAVMVPTPMTIDLVWWLRGEVDVDALQRAADDVHYRHQALHASYPISGPDMGHATLPAQVDPVGFHRLPDQDTDEKAVLALREVLKRPLHIDRGEVWRCVLVCSTASERKLFALTAHHAAFDGWSGGIVTDELSRAYAARAAGAVPRFEAPAASLADVTAAYRRQLAASDLDGQRAYWLGEFRGLRPCHLPGRSPELVPPAGPAAVCTLTVEAQRLKAWEEYGSRMGYSPFVWITAVYAQALVRAGGPRDLGIMVTIANRGDDLVDRSVTCRLGTVCLRPDAPSRKGRDLLARVQDAYAGAMAAADVLLDPMEVGRATLTPPGQPPPLQAMPFLMFQDVQEPIRLGDVVATAAPEFDDAAGVDFVYLDLSLQAHRHRTGELSLAMVVRSDLYPASLADTITQHWLKVIEEGPAHLVSQP